MMHVGENIPVSKISIPVKQADLVLKRSLHAFIPFISMEFANKNIVFPQYSSR